MKRPITYGPRAFPRQIWRAADPLYREPTWQEIVAVAGAAVAIVLMLF